MLLKHKVAVITGAGYSPGHQATEALAMMRAVPGIPEKQMDGDRGPQWN